MRKFWTIVLLGTAFLLCTPMSKAQQPTGTGSRPTSPVVGTGTGGAAAAPTGPVVGDTQPTSTERTPTAAAPAPAKVAVVPVQEWSTYAIVMAMVAAIGAIVLIYYIFVRQRTD